MFDWLIVNQDCHWRILSMWRFKFWMRKLEVFIITPQELCSNYNHYYAFIYFSLVCHLCVHACVCSSLYFLHVMQVTCHNISPLTLWNALQYLTLLFACVHISRWEKASCSIAANNNSHLCFLFQEGIIHDDVIIAPPVAHKRHKRSLHKSLHTIWRKKPDVHDFIDDELFRNT